MAAVVDTSAASSGFNELCRLCASKTGLLLGINIFQNDGIIAQLRKKIETCLPIQVHESDELPKVVCENCIFKLNQLYEFRDRSVRTERLLIDVLKEIHQRSLQDQHCMATMDQSNLLMVHHQQLLSSHGISTMDQLDLNQQLIVEEEIILGNHNVDINGHPLETIDLNHHELASQDLSNHSLQGQDQILVETTTHHPIEGVRFTGTNLDLIQHQQLINEQFGLHHEVHINDSAAVNGIAIDDGLCNTIVHHKLEDNIQHNEVQYHIPEEKVNGLTSFHNSPEDQVKYGDGTTDEMLSPKLEDSNSNNSLLIDEHFSQVNEQNKTVYLLPNGEPPNNVQTNPSETVMVNGTASEWMYCSICGKGYEDDLSFETHYETHLKTTCTICNAVFASVEVLNVHRKEAHGDTTEDIKPIKTRLKRATLPIKTDINSGESNSEDSNNSGNEFSFDNVEEEEENENDDSLAAEEKKESGNGKRKTWSPKVCTECGKSYKTNYKLNEHMRKHTGEKPYKCETCGKEFRSKIGLAQHAAKHTGKYDYACPTCGKGFQCKSYLMVHQRVHSDVKPYPCTTCGRNFKTKQSLLDHTNRHLGVKPYMCDICGRGFITKGLCKAHQKVHTGLDNRKYSCKVCNKMFVSKSYLQTHLRIHTGEKPFMCEVCGKGFLTKVDLRIHTTMHTGEKSYVCEMCGKAFARRDALRCHRRSHTGERPYSCDLCGQTFTQFTPMAIHKRLHTGERPYVCESCGKTFVSRSTMMSHAKKHIR